MPVYEYECDKCHAVTEVLRKMADASEPQPCEKCGSTRTHRCHSVFNAGSGQSADVGMCTGDCACGNPHGPCAMQ